MSFQIIRNDITKVKADAIVNTANPLPTYGGGTDSAIYTAAGAEELLEARRKIGNIARGEAFETPAFALKAKYIIHTVGPVWKGGNSGEFDTLRSCYENSLRLALKLKCRSIAFPLIATGVYGFPKDKALQIAMSVIEPFVSEHSMKVILVVFSKSAFELSGSMVDNVREYVDSNYVEEANKREYRFDNERRRRSRAERESDYFGSVHFENRDCDEAAADYKYCLTSGAPPVMSSEPASYETASYIDIEKLISSPEKTFQEKLFEIIDERGLTGPQVYKNYISKQVYSKIQADKDYHPNKYTALALCLSLHLDIAETQDLIGRAGWTLSPSSKADLVVKGCILNKEYNIVNINIILFDYDLPVLEKIR